LLNIATLLEMAAITQSDQVVVVARDEHLTSPELLNRAGRGAAILRAAGANRLAYLGVSDAALPVALFASLWAEVPFMPLSYRQPLDSLVALLADHPGSVVMAPDDLAAGLAPTDAPLLAPADWWAGAGDAASRWDDDPEGVAVLLHTSGTTSGPKAVVLRHRHVTSCIMNATELLGAAGETVLVSVPPYHIAGVANLLTNLYAGRRIVYLSSFTAKGVVGRRRGRRRHPGHGRADDARPHRGRARSERYRRPVDAAVDLVRRRPHAPECPRTSPPHVPRRGLRERLRPDGDVVDHRRVGPRRPCRGAGG
jgi:acyl-CoA synthetase (AMP-forming)/AMP-acid ligase II